MKKNFLLAALVLTSASLFAYNPPFGGEDMLRFTNPELLSGSASASGGPLFNTFNKSPYTVPASIVYNPALTAKEQRSVLNLSAGLLYDSNSDADAASFDTFGWGVQAGLLIPTKYFVFSTSTQALFADDMRADLGDSLVVHLGLSKDVTENLFVGANLYSGFYFANGNDFTLGADLGLLYLFKHNLGILKNPRFGLAFLNIGKPLGDSYDVMGLDYSSDSTGFPSAFTPCVSFASTLFNLGKLNGGFSGDLSFPHFQNLVFDTAFAVGISNESGTNIFSASLGWNFNMKEYNEIDKLNWPSLGLNARIIISSKKIASSNKDWEQSEIVPAAAWQNVYDGFHVFTGGATLNLGQLDTASPEIILWDDK